MTILDTDSEVSSLRAEEERILASFTQRLVEIAADTEARASSPSPIIMLNAVRLPAITLDRHGFVTDVNAAADAVFDCDIKIKDRRLFVRDLDSRTLLREALDQLKTPTLNSVVSEPIIVPRMDKYPSSCEFGPLRGRCIRRGRKWVLF